MPVFVKLTRQQVRDPHTQRSVMKLYCWGATQCWGHTQDSALLMSNGVQMRWKGVVCSIWSTLLADLDIWGCFTRAVSSLNQEAAEHSYYLKKRKRDKFWHDCLTHSTMDSLGPSLHLFQALFGHHLRKGWLVQKKGRAAALMAAIQPS